MPIESEGQLTTKITTGSVNTLVYKGTGRFNAILMNAAATGAIVIYDSATAAASGTVIGYVSATSPIGTFQAYDIPFALGISVNDAAAGSQVITIVYTASS